MHYKLVQNCSPCCACKTHCRCADLGFEAQFVKEARACVTVGTPPIYAGSVRGWNTTVIRTRWATPPAWLTAMLQPGETLYYLVLTGAARAGRIPTVTADDWTACIDAGQGDPAIFPPGHGDCTIAGVAKATRANPAGTQFWPGFPDVPGLEHGPVIFRGNYTNPNPDLSTLGWCATLEPEEMQCVADCGRPGNVFLRAMAVPSSGTPRELAQCAVCPPAGDECKRACCCPEDAPPPVWLKLVGIDENGDDAGDYVTQLVPVTFSGGGLATGQCRWGYQQLTGVLECTGVNTPVLITYRNFQDAACTLQSWGLTVTTSAWAAVGGFSAAGNANGCLGLPPQGAPGDTPKTFMLSADGDGACFGAHNSVRATVSLEPP